MNGNPNKSTKLIDSNTKNSLSLLSPDNSFSFNNIKTRENLYKKNLKPIYVIVRTIVMDNVPVNKVAIVTINFQSENSEIHAGLLY